MESLTDLTPKQKKAFDKLKKAFNDCEKLNIYFVNMYGHLHAYDRDKICGFGDYQIRANGIEERNLVDDLKSQTGHNYIKVPNEWCDDAISHFFGLTEKGAQLFKDGCF